MEHGALGIGIGRWAFIGALGIGGHWALGVGGHWALGIGRWALVDIGCWALVGIGHCSLVPGSSMPPVFDRLPYAKTEGEGLGNFIT